LKFGKKKLLTKNKFLRYKKKKKEKLTLVKKNQLNHSKNKQTNNYSNTLSKALRISLKKNDEKNKYNNKITKRPNKKTLRFFKSKK
jgi:hypothetical protein